MKWERTVTVIGCHVGGEDNHDPSDPFRGGFTLPDLWFG